MVINHGIFTETVVVDEGVHPCICKNLASVVNNNDNDNNNNINIK
jgi:hypothetical protein